MHHDSTILRRKINEKKREQDESRTSIYQSFPPRPRNEISTRASSRGKTVSATAIKRGENEKKYSISGALYTRDIRMEDHERWSRDDGTLDDRSLDFTSLNRSRPVFRLNSSREMEKRGFVATSLLLHDLAQHRRSLQRSWRPSRLTSGRCTDLFHFILVSLLERYCDFKLFDRGQIYWRE